MFSALHFATSLSDGPDSTNTHYDYSELLCRQLSADQLSPRIVQLWRLDYCLQGLNKLWTPKMSTAYRGKRQVRSPRRAESVVQPVKGSLALDDQAKLSTGRVFYFSSPRSWTFPCFPIPANKRRNLSPLYLLLVWLISPPVDYWWAVFSLSWCQLQVRLPRQAPKCNTNQVSSPQNKSVNACRNRHDYGMILLLWLFLAWIGTLPI